MCNILLFNVALTYVLTYLLSYFLSCCDVDVAKRQRHYYEGESDNSVETLKRRRVTDLSPCPSRSSSQAIWFLTEINVSG